MPLSKQHPFIFIDDDKDDCDMMVDVMSQLGYTENVLCFNNGLETISYIKDGNVKPFIIVCDINMPLINGFELRHKLQDDESLKFKTVPFVFFSTSSEKNTIKQAYELSVHGFFAKPHNVGGWLTIMKNMIEYWKYAQLPNRVS